MPQPAQPPSMTQQPKRRLLLMGGAAALAAHGLPGCESNPSMAVDSHEVIAMPASRASLYRVIHRLSWSATLNALDRAAEIGYERYVDEQLRATGSTALPPLVQAQIDALKVQKVTLPALLKEMEQMRKTGEALPTEEGRKTAQQAYQKELTRWAREAATRHLLRAVYSGEQLHAHMSWFWFNHFNVHQAKSNVRAMLGDYEESALRPHALGRFRDLLGAVVRHPAMLRYLDNDQNAVRRLNENHARELLELHTMGVDGGYRQTDVQELARVLTGFGINFNDTPPKLRPEQEKLYVRQGAFEFNPNRHDFASKTLFGRTLKAQGADEVDEALDWIVQQPATARFISRKLAQYLLTDEPPTPVIERMAQTFQASDGRIDATLRVLLLSREFMAASEAPKFKDPMHFVISAVRTSYEDKVILNTLPMQNWLNRVGQGLYNRQTPDGYPLTAAAWTSSGQMSTRFEIARTIGNGNAGLFKSDDPLQPVDKPAFPQLANALYFDTLRSLIGSDTRAALEQAGSPQEWNALFLSSPEFMYR